MNLTRLLFIPALAAALLAGCVPPSSQTSTRSGALRTQPAPGSAEAQQAQIARVLEMQRAGQLTQQQALEVIAAITGTPAGTATAAPATPVSATPAAPTTPVAVQPSAAPGLDNRYVPTAQLRGRLRSIGSDTMDRVMADWERLFIRYHPELRVTHEGRGSSTAAPALIEELSDFGPMSRAPQPSELQRFEAKFGYPLTAVRVAIDALGIYVHPSNPIAQRGLTLAELDAIFSATRKRGGQPIQTWGQLGLTGEWANAPIRLYSRNRASGTYGYFLEAVLQKGDFLPTIVELPGSAEVVRRVGDDRFGIGYSGIGYKTDAVVTVPLSAAPERPFVAPSEAAALDGTYPLARPLYLIFNHRPGSRVSDLIREFLTFAYSPVGQGVVQNEGFYPIPAAIAAEEMAKIR